MPRLPSPHPPFSEEEEDQLADMPSRNVFSTNPPASRPVMPMTAAVDGHNNRFAQQMGQRTMNPNSVPFIPAGFHPNTIAQSPGVQNQALQMQMLQLEMLRMQTIQAQQMQAEMIAQAQIQQQQQQQAQMQTRERRTSLPFPPPATAGPTANSFDLRSATLSAQIRRAQQAEQMMSQLGIAGEQVPMTAALGGKFGSRTMSLTNATGATQRFVSEDSGPSPLPPTPYSTTVISGGTSLGNHASNNTSSNNAGAVPSKSDSATSWRRSGNNSVLRGNNRTVSSPTVRVTPPPGEQSASLAGRFRPQPLRFSPAASQPLPEVTIDTSSDSNDDASSSSSAASNSSPTTPRSSASSDMPLSPREEASKKLYEGLGIGRPASVVSLSEQQYPVTSVASHRVVSQPMRQPRGPPSGADELGPKNFATRIRRKAIGGLGMLMGARERRELVEAY
jgi:hypothetical protein